MLKKIGTFLSAGLLVSSAAFGQADLSYDDALQAFNFVKDGTQFSGTGCPEWGTQVVDSPDGKVVTILFSEFYSMSDEFNPGLVRKNCNVAFDVSVPPGWTWGTARTDYVGFFNADVPGDYAMQSSLYFFQGNISTNNLKYATCMFQDGANQCWKVESRYADRCKSMYANRYRYRSFARDAARNGGERIECSSDFTTGESFNIGAGLWSPCGQKRKLIMNLSTVAETASPTGNAALFLDLTDTTLDTVYNYNHWTNNQPYAAKFLLKRCRDVFGTN